MLHDASQGGLQRASIEVARTCLYEGRRTDSMSSAAHEDQTGFLEEDMSASYRVAHVFCRFSK
jgi:hypothetical protein